MAKVMLYENVVSTGKGEMGELYKRKGEVYILSVVDYDGDYILVNLNDGCRWTNPLPEEEMLAEIKDEGFQFIPNPVITVKEGA